jgi:proteasome lid subunit RPN8/RPN11
MNMTYRDRLSPWCIIERLPNLQRSTLYRSRSRSAAEECLKVLQRFRSGDYEIVFDIGNPQREEQVDRVTLEEIEFL